MRIKVSLLNYGVSKWYLAVNVLTWKNNNKNLATSIGLLVFPAHETHETPLGGCLNGAGVAIASLVGTDDLKHAFFKVFGLSLCNFHPWQPTPPTASLLRDAPFTFSKLRYGLRLLLPDPSSLFPFTVLI